MPDLQTQDSRRKTHRHWLWLAVLVGILVLGEGLGWLLAAQGAPSVAAALRWVGRIAAALWIARGLFLWRELPWVRRLGLAIMGTIVVGLLALACLARGYHAGAIALAGVWCMAAAFIVGLLLIRLLLQAGHPILGVARTAVDEAIRMKVALVFLVALLLIVPMLPLALSPDDLLRYRIQGFLTWSMMVVAILLSLMTIFIAAGTISTELTQRQIFLTLTKPVSRGQYLLGKWLGIMLLNLLLVGVSGGGIYVGARMLAAQRARTAADRWAVDQEVLTAREAFSPQPVSKKAMQDQYEARLKKLRAQEPQTYGQPGSPLAAVSPKIKHDIQQTVLTQWYTIGARQTATYVFHNVHPPTSGSASSTSEAGASGATSGVTSGAIQLRLKPKAAGEASMDYLNMRVNGRQVPVPPLSDGDYHVLNIPTRLIGPDGTLTIELTNAVLPDGTVQPTISFNTADGLQVLYRVGSFEGNLTRALTLLWVQLGFLAMLGLAAGTFLGFPTACLLAAMVYIAAAFSGYLGDSLHYYAAFPSASLSTFDKMVWVPQTVYGHLAQGQIWEAIKVVVRLIGQGFMLLVPSLSKYNGTSNVAEGLLVSLSLVGEAMLWVGVVWTGVVAIFGWLVFRKRELARVTV